MGKIWKHINTNSVISVQAWKVFALRVAQDEEAEKRCIHPNIRRHIAFVHKTQPLGAYIKPLLSGALLTHLTITGAIRCDAPELLQLTQLKNLAILEFLGVEKNETSWRLSDDILRAWSISPNPFPQLAILRVWGLGQTTEISLRYLNSFPSLVVYEVAGDYNDWPERREYLGWKRVDNTWHPGILSETLRKQTKILSEFDRVAHLTDERPEIPVQLADAWRKVKSYPHSGLSHSERSNVGNPWGFLLYCYLGGKALPEGDKFDSFFPRYAGAWGPNYDFRARAVPPRPMLNLVLRGAPVRPGYRDRTSLPDMVPYFFSVQATFFRCPDKGTTNAPESESQSERAAAKRPSDDPLASRKLRKKKHVVSNILESFLQ